MAYRRAYDLLGIERKITSKLLVTVSSEHFLLQLVKGPAIDKGDQHITGSQATILNRLNPKKCPLSIKVSAVASLCAWVPTYCTVGRTFWKHSGRPEASQVTLPAFPRGDIQVKQGYVGVSWQNSYSECVYTPKKGEAVGMEYQFWLL